MAFPGPTSPGCLLWTRGALAQPSDPPCPASGETCKDSPSCEGLFLVLSACPSGLQGAEPQTQPAPLRGLSSEPPGPSWTLSQAQLLYRLCPPSPWDAKPGRMQTASAWCTWFPDPCGPRSQPSQLTAGPPGMAHSQHLKAKSFIASYVDQAVCLPLFQALGWAVGGEGYEH